MPEVKLRIDALVLDGDNPRITHADGQQQALQKVVKDQKTKLVRLAESIVEHGLSPIEKFMVMEVSPKPQRYVALEGNRRVTVLKLLANPAVMTGLDMPEGIRRSLERLASIFDRSKVEPIDAFEVSSREEGRYWIELRHNGEDEGRGVVAWKPIVAARYREKEPAIQAFDMVIEHGGFEEAEAEDIRTGFSLTTLRRLLELKRCESRTRPVRGERPIKNHPPRTRANQTSAQNCARYRRQNRRTLENSIRPSECLNTFGVSRKRTHQISATRLQLVPSRRSRKQNLPKRGQNRRQAREWRRPSDVTQSLEIVSST